MIVKPGEKVHVVIRRAFREDIRRHFVGEVKDTTDTAVRVEGHAFVYDTSTNLFVRKQHGQVRIFSLITGANIITVLPATTILKKLAYRFTEKSRMVLTDGESFTMDVNEFGSNR
jgi:hypothetical protein